MAYQIFAMDTSFYHSLGAYSFDARCEMLQELGYDATYLSLWSEDAWHDVPQLKYVKERYGLDVAGVYVTIDIAAADDHEGNRRIVQLVETLEGCTNVEVTLRSGDPSLKSSDPAGDGLAARRLHRLLAAAEPRGITLSLYPHISFWMERIEDAVRLCRQLDHPRLGAVFCGFHWYAVDGKHLPERLQEAAPFLRSANVCGSRRKVGSTGLPATIEPLDEGELDNFAVLALLRATGYRGMVGIQGYSVGGDVYSKLKRSLAAFRDIERRLDRHPDWAMLRRGAG